MNNNTTIQMDGIESSSTAQLVSYPLFYLLHFSIHWNTHSRTSNFPDNVIFVSRTARITPNLSEKYLQSAVTRLILTCKFPNQDRNIDAN